VKKLFRILKKIENFGFYPKGKRVVLRNKIFLPQIGNGAPVEYTLDSLIPQLSKGKIIRHTIPKFSTPNAKKTGYTLYKQKIDKRTPTLLQKKFIGGGKLFYFLNTLSLIRSFEVNPITDYLAKLISNELFKSKPPKRVVIVRFFPNTEEEKGFYANIDNLYLSLNKVQIFDTYSITVNSGGSDIYNEYGVRNPAELMEIVTDLKPDLVIHHCPEKFAEPLLKYCNKGNINAWLLTFEQNKSPLWWCETAETLLEGELMPRYTKEFTTEHVSTTGKVKQMRKQLKKAKKRIQASRENRNLSRRGRAKT